MTRTATAAFWRRPNGGEQMASGDLVELIIVAARAGRYPHDGRFYFVSAVAPDRQAEAIERYLTFDDARELADERQRLAEASGNVLGLRYEIRSRDSGVTVYRAPMGKRS